MIGSSVTAHEFHGFPIFAAFLGIEREPGQAFEFGMQILVEIDGGFAVVAANRRAGAAAAAVAEEGEVFARFEVADFFASGEKAEFDEMISAAAGAELGP